MAWSATAALDAKGREVDKSGVLVYYSLRHWPPRSQRQRSLQKTQLQHRKYPQAPSCNARIGKVSHTSRAPGRAGGYPGMLRRLERASSKTWYARGIAERVGISRGHGMVVESGSEKCRTPPKSAGEMSDFEALFSRPLPSKLRWSTNSHPHLRPGWCPSMLAQLERI